MNKPERIRYRRVAISREGFSFLFVLLFIVVGALVRQVNLLFVLASLLIAALLLNWRYAMSVIAKLNIRREAPDWVHAGAPVGVDVIAASDHRRLICWSVNVQDEVTQISNPAAIHRQADEPARNKRLKPKTVTANIPEVLPQNEGRSSYSCQFEQRGEYRLGPIVLSTRFPLGLVRAYGTIDSQQSILVGPRIGRLSSRWLQIVQAGLGAGERRTPRHSASTGGEFYSIRAWRSGDSRRSIHWRSTARTGKLEVRQFEQLEQSSLTMVLDMWLPAEPVEEDFAACELATSLAATAFVHASQHQTGRICFAVASDQQHILCGQCSRSLADSVMRCLATVSATQTPDTAVVIDRAIAEMREDCRVVVISPRAAISDGAVGDGAISDEELRDSNQGELSDDPETDSPQPRDLVWIDVSSEQIDSYYQL